MKKFLAVALILALCLISIHASAEGIPYLCPVECSEFTVWVSYPESEYVITPEMLDAELIADLGDFGVYLSELFTDETIRGYIYDAADTYEGSIIEIENDMENMDSLVGTLTHYKTRFNAQMKMSTGMNNVYDLFKGTYLDFMKVTTQEGYIAYTTIQNYRMITFTFVSFSESGFTPEEIEHIESIVSATEIHEKSASSGLTLEEPEISATMQTVTVYEIGLTMDVPDNHNVVYRNTPGNSEIFDKLGMPYIVIMEDMTFSDSYIHTFTDDMLMEIEVSVKSSETTEITSEIMDDLSTRHTKNGGHMAKSEILEAAGFTFARHEIDAYMNFPMLATIFTTYHNGNEYTVYFYNYTGINTPETEQMMKKCIDSLTIE